jgi:hypothetical protein
VSDRYGVDRRQVIVPSGRTCPLIGTREELSRLKAG